MDHTPLLSTVDAGSDFTASTTSSNTVVPLPPPFRTQTESTLLNHSYGPQQGYQNQQPYYEQQQKNQQIQHQQQQPLTFDNTGYCLLSLDGGGVRGLSTLYILQGIMNRLNYGREEAGLRPRKPCEIFDLIGGTSTGGLIAIMLGRLEMTVEECIDAYKKMMKQVFEKKENRSVLKRLGGVAPQFSSKELENAIKQVLKSRGVSADERFEAKGGKCKVFVCTRFQKTNATTRIRSYRTPTHTSLNPTILEAALATSAAPTYFSPASISSSHFIDGALGANNPCLELEEEATDLWCEETGHLQPLVKCFVCIGTGNPGVRSVSDKGWKYFVETLAKEATETEATNQKWLGRWRDAVEKGRAFRFNVDHGLEGVGLAEWKEGDLLEATAATYLGKRGTIGDVRACVENLRAKEYEPTPEFTTMLKKQALLENGQKSPTSKPKATSTEISELISLGSTYLRQNPPHLSPAYTSFTTALALLKDDSTTPPKQVSRLCQKLTQTSLLLSMSTRRRTTRKQHAAQAREYADKALENAKFSGDECMVAQAEFMGACVGIWKVVVDGDGGGDGGLEKREVAEVLLGQRLDGLRAFGEVRIQGYEDMAERYLGYLRRLG